MRLLLAILIALFSVQLHAQVNDEKVRFIAVDIYVDSKNAALAAYQLEFSVKSGDAKIAGIEGGEHPQFSDAPFYDAKAMQQERVIIAAFSTQTAENLPTGKTRVATIHMLVKGANAPVFELKVEAAADAGENRISVDASFQERQK